MLKILLFLYFWLFRLGNTEITTDSPYSNNDYECNQSGYLDYLRNWSTEEKSSSRDPTSKEFTDRLGYFKENCKRIHDWNRRDRYKLEFTYYADWSADEFGMLSETTQQYSGIKPIILETEEYFNNTNLQYLLPSLDPCDDVFEEGENTLRDTINKPQSCSVSWAFAITNSIEYAVKKMYLEDYGYSMSIALSAQELIDCAGRNLGIENGCDGVPLAWGFDYVFENGIAYRQYYPQTNVYGECKVIPNNQKYNIAGYEKPEVYNKLGLFELLKKGPVAVTLGLDPEYFQFYQNYKETGPYFSSSYYRPSVYGVLLESKQYVEEGKEEFAEWPYFSVETRLRACDSVVFRLPILESVDNANIGGIAGFAIRPIVNEPVSTSYTCNENIYPTIESIPACASELIFNNNSYPNIQTLDLSRFTQLKTLIVKNGAFADCYSVYVDNPDLTVIDIGDNCFTGVPPTGEARRLAGFSFGLVFANLPSLTCLTIGKNSFTGISTVKVDVVKETATISIGSSSLKKVESVMVSEITESQTIGNSIASSIESANPGKTVEVVINTPTPTPTPTPTVTPTHTPTPDPCENSQSLTINSDSSCGLLLQNGWKSITVNQGLCNSMTSNLTISDNPCLESIVIKKNSLKNLNSLVISNNPQLSSIVTENGQSWDSSLKTYYAPFENVKRVKISNLPKLSTFTTYTGSFKKTTSLTLSNLPKLSTFTTGDHSFCYTRSLTLSNLPNLKTFTTGYQSFSYLPSLTLSNYPNLSTFTTGYESFCYTTSLTLSNLPNLSTFTAGHVSFSSTTSVTLSNLPNLKTFNTGWQPFFWTTSVTLSNVPFTNGYFYKGSSAFAWLSCSGITCDSVSTNLYNQIRQSINCS